MWHCKVGPEEVRQAGGGQTKLRRDKVRQTTPHMLASPNRPGQTDWAKPAQPNQLGQTTSAKFAKHIWCRKCSATHVDSTGRSSAYVIYAAIHEKSCRLYRKRSQSSAKAIHRWISETDFFEGETLVGSRRLASRTAWQPAALSPASIARKTREKRKGDRRDSNP